MKSLLALILLSSSVFAQGIQYESYTIPVAQRDCAMRVFGQPGVNMVHDIPVTFPNFVTALGTLTDVEIILNYTPTWEYRAENLFSAPSQGPINWGRGFQLNCVFRPTFMGPIEFNERNTVGFGSPSSNGAFGIWPPGTAAYDGVLDWAGPSGISTSYGLSGVYQNTVVLHANSALELWYFGLPGPKTFYLSPRWLFDDETGWPSHIFAFDDDIRLHFGGTVNVLYHFQ